MVTDLRPPAEAGVKRACIALTNASVANAGSKPHGVTWRLRDANGYIFARLEFSAAQDGTPTTDWAFR